MKRELRFTKLFKQVLALAVVFVASTISAFAGEQAYYDYYANLTVYPSGTGKVYVTDEASDSRIFTDAVGLPMSDMQTPAENIEVKYIYQYSESMGFNAKAIPNDGWIFAGFSACTKNEAGEHIFNDNIISKDNPGYLGLTAKISDKDLNNAQAMFPFEADSTFYALFTHIAVSPYIGQDSLGTTAISKVCNNIGEEVTLTATPRDPEHTTFDYWYVEETGEKVTTNPLTLTVKGCAHYVAHFKSDLAETIYFPEEGGYAVFHSDYSVSVPTNASILTFNYSSGESGDSVLYNKEKQVFYQEADTTGYNAYTGEPYIMYGKGEATFLKNGTETSSYSTSLLKWTGDEAVEVASLPAAVHYYSINLEKQQFDLISEEGTIPAGTAYFALPNSCYEVYGVEEAPAVIYWNDPDKTTGIQAVESTPAKANAKKGIYNILGQKFNKMNGKGLYIVNGKKVLNLAK